MEVQDKLVPSLCNCCFYWALPIPTQETVNIMLLCYMLQGKYEQQYEQSEEFKQELKMKVREILTEQEWRRRKMQMRVRWKLDVFFT